VVRWLTLVVALGGLCLGCEKRKELECDINEDDCRKAIFQVVLRVRGDAFDPFAPMPPVDEMTPEAFGASLRARSTPETAESLGWKHALGMLRFIDPAQTLSDASIEHAVRSVAAFYTPTTKRVTIIKRPRDADEQIDAMATLAHEFVHAVQDREVDLRRSGALTDAQWARRALIEGDAKLYEMLSVADFFAVSEGWIGWDRYFTAYETSLRKSVASDKNRFLTAQSLVYPLGGRFLADRFWQGGNPEIRRLYPAAPSTSAHYMHGANGSPQLASFAPCEAVAPAGFTPFGEDSFGAVEVFAYLVSGLPDERAWTLALGWTGDRVRAFRRPEGEGTAVTWSIGLAEAASVTDAELAQLAYAPNVRVQRRADGLLVTAASDVAVLDAMSCGAAGAPAAEYPVAAPSARGLPELRDAYGCAHSSATLRGSFVGP
jgi:hypothetical protein